LLPRLDLRRERLAVIVRSRDPDRAPLLGSGLPFTVAVKDGIDVPPRVCRDRPSAVDCEGARGEVPLRLEAAAIRHRPRVQEGSAALFHGRIHWSARFGFVRPVPGHVGAARSPDRQLPAADGADRNRAARLAVDADRHGKRPARIRGADVEDISTSGIAGEVDQVKVALDVDRRFGLNPAVRDPPDLNLAGGLPATVRVGMRDEEAQGKSHSRPDGDERAGVDHGSLISGSESASGP